MSRMGREAPLPDEMQGRWVDSQDPSYVVEIRGGEVTYGACQLVRPGSQD